MVLIFTPPNIIDFVVVYKLDIWSWDLNSDFTINDCLLRGIKLGKDVDPDKFIYSDYGVGFG